MKTIKITITTLVLLGTSIISFAQNNVEGVKISDNVTPPNPSAMLEVEANDKGVLFPRVVLEKLNNATNSPISNPENSLLVYHSGTPNPIPAGFEEIAEGFYYWAGSKWIRLGSIGSMIPKVTFNEMQSMVSNLGYDDLGMQVYVTDFSVSDPNLLPQNGNTGVVLVEVEGLYFFSRHGFCPSTNSYNGGYVWKKIDGNHPLILPVSICY